MRCMIYSSKYKIYVAVPGGTLSRFDFLIGIARPIGFLVGAVFSSPEPKALR